MTAIGLVDGWFDFFCASDLIFNPLIVRMLSKVLRFAVVGLVVTGMHILVTVCLVRWLFVHPVGANGVAFVCATGVSFLLNTMWSFSSKVQARVLIKYFLVSVVGLCLTMAAASIMQAFGVDYIKGVFVVAGVVPVATFLLHHFWTYV